jgi:triacylglycerol lipase
MLTRLLQLAILCLMLLGLGLGYALHHFANASVVWLPLLALGLPVFVLLCSSIYSSMLARVGWNALGWRAIAGEILASIIIFLLRQPWSFKPPVLLPAPGETAQTPVILVHGYLCNHRIWHRFVPALHAKGHSVFPVNLEPVFTSIENYSTILEDAVKQATQNNPHQRVILVGHSMGGIVIRDWMRKHGSERVAGVITLGSPHQGTVLGQTAMGANARQMAWRSPWLKALAASENQARRRLFRIAITLQDNIVFPQRLQQLPGVPAQHFEGMGHLQMCLHPDVLAWVMQQIQEIQQQETKK